MLSGFRTQQRQVQRQADRAVREIGKQEAGVLGAQSVQAGKVGLAGGGGSFAAMQQQVRQQAAEDVKRTQQRAGEDLEQLQQDIQTTSKMADIRIEQSEAADAGLLQKRDQSSFLAGLGGVLGGGLSGFTAAGGDVGGVLQGLGAGIDEAFMRGRASSTRKPLKGNLATPGGISGMGTTPWNPSEGF